MQERQSILGLKCRKGFSPEERRIIIEDYLRSGKSKDAVWRQHTGKGDHGVLLRWMRREGYQDSRKLAGTSTTDMPKKNQADTVEAIQLKEKIKQLEQALINSELRATALDTMIAVAEKELKVSIRKKPFTKQSTK